MQIQHYAKSAHLRITTSNRRKFWTTHGISKSLDLYDILMTLTMPSKNQASILNSLGVRAF